jgi:subtilase family serine protease
LRQGHGQDAFRGSQGGPVRTARVVALAASAGAFAGCAGGGGSGFSAPMPITPNLTLRSPTLDIRADSLPQPACQAPATPGRARCYVIVGPPRSTLAPNLASSGFYDPAQLQSAYNLPSATAGGSYTVSIVDAYDDPNVEADLGVYRANYGLSPCTTANGCFEKLNQSGEKSPLPVGDQSWGFEISLDTQMVSAICPKCKIRLIEANSSGFGDLMTGIDTAIRLGPHVISTSWGSGEFAGETSYDVHFNHPGFMITNSSGDGAYAAGTQYPAASPYVTAVGGTTLVPAANTRGWSETVWSNLPGQGSGSGCSLYEPKPAWQHDTGCAKRTIADVAAVADSVAGYDSYTSQPGFYSFYGTSVSSPIVAGVYALAENGVPLTWGKPYAHPSGLYDITKGNTGTCSPTYLCSAVAGYDGPTGNGTPHGITAF